MFDKNTYSKYTLRDKVKTTQTELSFTSYLNYHLPHT